MDALEVLKKAEELGGESRKKAILSVLREARECGCEYSPGGGKVGGFNISYGSEKYSVMDVNCEGTVFLHIKPSANQSLSDEEREEANQFIDSLEGIAIKGGPIHSYGQADKVVEDLPLSSLVSFLTFAVERIDRLFG
ncbi:MAG: hypothetical protein KC561_00620 [Myxococcales bacterium]|nr:hypothetical protein [Myxococcales bacterium]